MVTSPIGSNFSLKWNLERCKKCQLSYTVIHSVWESKIKTDRNYRSVFTNPKSQNEPIPWVSILKRDNDSGGRSLRDLMRAGPLNYFVIVVWAATDCRWPCQARPCQAMPLSFSSGSKKLVAPKRSEVAKKEREKKNFWGRSSSIKCSVTRRQCSYVLNQLIMCVLFGLMTYQQEVLRLRL